MTLISKPDLPSDEELAGTIADPLWRIRNLYSIVDKQGRKIPFFPNWVQEQLLEDLYVRGERRLLVLKSRKHGVSTLFEVVLFDWCYWGENLQASIVDLTHGNASDKLTGIVRTLWENLDPDIRQKLVADSQKEISFTNASSIHAGKNARGGQNQLLHISEWGPIAHEDPERSTEIKTGAMPSADEGIQLIESTFKGGKGGDFYNLIKRTLETPEDQRTPKDFRFRFFPWFVDSRNTLQGDVGWIPKATLKYLSDLEQSLGLKLSDGQKVWYFKTLQEQGIFMRREYPSTVEEAFNAPVEGAIYGEVIDRLRTAGHIIPFSRDPSAPVYASWDIGWDDCTSVWLIQPRGRDLNVLHHLTVRHESAGQVMQRLDRTEIPITGHLLPHDAAAKDAGSGLSYADQVKKAGGLNVVIVPRVQNIWTGINITRDLLARCWFNAPACEYGLNALESYHTKDNTVGGVTTKDPVHDWSSHPASAFRAFAEATELGLVNTQIMRPVMMAPRSPEGEVLVDLEHVRQHSLFKRRGLAKSGSRRRD